MIDPRALRDRALAVIPGPETPTPTLVLFALGAGALATVAVSAVEQFARLVLQQRAAPIAGDTLAVAAGVLVACFARGLDRAALWVAFVHAVYLAATFFTALLAYAALGRRAVGDPLAQLGPAFTSLALGALVAAALGIVARAALPPRGDRAPVLVRAVGIAVLTGTVVHVVWPSSLFIAVAGAARPDDVRGVLLALPDLLAGPIAGGIYAARRGAGYTGLLAVGALLALPSALTEVALVPARVASDPSIRGAFASLTLLLALRIAAWPLAAAFAYGFLTPPPRAPTVERDI